jgi:hypothetical protein
MIIFLPIPAQEQKKAAAKAKGLATAKAVAQAVMKQLEKGISGLKVLVEAKEGEDNYKVTSASLTLSAAQEMMTQAHPHIVWHALFDWSWNADDRSVVFAMIAAHIMQAFSVINSQEDHLDFDLKDVKNMAADIAAKTKTEMLHMACNTCTTSHAYVQFQRVWF